MLIWTDDPDMVVNPPIDTEGNMLSVRPMGEEIARISSAGALKIFHPELINSDVERQIAGCLMSKGVESSDIPGILAHALNPAPQPVTQPAPAPTPQGLGTVREGDHRLGDFSGALS